MKTWKKFKTDNIHEAETLSWKSLNPSERKDLLKDAGLPSSFAKETWKELDGRAKERIGKMINKTTGGEFRMDERFGGDANIPASKQTTDIIQHPKAKILVNVKSTLSDKARFVVIERPLGHKGELRSNQDKVLMATISDPKGGRVKMFAFHGSHVSHQKAMQFAKQHKLVAREDADGYSLYAKESVELGEGKMKELHMLIQDGKTAEQIAKIMKIDVKAIKALMKDFKESIELDEDKLKDLIAKYKKTGRSAFHYPRKKQISLDGGRAMSEKDAIKNMKRVVGESVDELDEAKAGDVEFTYPSTGQAKAFSNTLVIGGVEGVVVKRGKTVIFNISDLNKADKMGRKTLADLVRTAKSNQAKIKSHGFTIEAVELEEKMTFEFGTSEQANKFADQAERQKLASVTDKFKSNYGDHMVELSGPHQAGAGSPTMAHKNLAKLMKKHDGKLTSTDEGPRIKKMFKESVELDEADNTASVAKQVKQAVKNYTTGKLVVRSKGGNTRFIMVRAENIDNKLRKMMADVMYPTANIKDKSNIHYGNISDNIISASVDHWVKALDLKESTDDMWTMAWHLKEKQIKTNKEQWEKAAAMQEGKYDSDPRIPKMSDKGKELLAWMARSFGETGGPYIDKDNVQYLTRYAIDRIVKKLKKLKGLPADKKKDMALVMKELGEGIEEETTTASVGTLTDPLDMGKKKKKRCDELDKYTDSQIFTVSSEDFTRCSKGRRKNERWSKFFAQESEQGTTIKKYSLRNPKSPIIIKNEETGDLMFLRRRLNDQRLRHHRSK